MNIHEYQAKEILKKYGVAVLNGRVAETPEEALLIAKELKGNSWAIKAQIYSGGRGKAGGIKIVKKLDDVKNETARILGMDLVTTQTGSKGHKVKRVYIEQGCSIKKEYYLGMLIDRITAKITIIASMDGGIDIETSAGRKAKNIIKVAINPKIGCEDFYVRRVAVGLELEGIASEKCVHFIKNMYRAFVELDASLIEVNPFVLTANGEVIALDAKMTFDDNALFRQKDIVALRDKSEEDAKEIEAAKNQLNYVALDGNVGCMVNGAGLAMATMDIIKLAGEKPANFLDVGGSATKERVSAAFKIILSDPKVKVILVNIFGGIMRCDIIAGGIVSAVREMSLNVPLVVRMAGTNFELGRQILADSGLSIIIVDNLADAAKKVVETIKDDKNRV